MGREKKENIVTYVDELGMTRKEERRVYKVGKQRDME